ncbi:MAG: hypothetical protein SVC26_09350 [Pseudomonadota bacterium]|nr:hypothetical protein [Pseudomonadota bacterium]
MDVFGPSGNQLDYDTVNAVTSQLYGGELEINFQPTWQLSVFGALAFVHTKFDEFENSNQNFA